jgi:uncharacterized membrane protein
LDNTKAGRPSNAILNFLHVLGVILMVGSVIITANWKGMADRSRDPHIIAHAQRSVNIGNWLSPRQE